MECSKNWERLWNSLLVTIRPCSLLRWMAGKLPAWIHPQAANKTTIHKFLYEQVATALGFDYFCVSLLTFVHLISVLFFFGRPHAARWKLYSHLLPTPQSCALKGEILNIYFFFIFFPLVRKLKVGTPALQSSRELLSNVQRTFRARFARRSWRGELRRVCWR